MLTLQDGCLGVLTCSRRLSASTKPCSCTVIQRNRCSTNVLYELQRSTTAFCHNRTIQYTV